MSISVVVVLSRYRGEGWRKRQQEAHYPDGDADEHRPPVSEEALVEQRVTHVQVAVEGHAGQEGDGHLK